MSNLKNNEQTKAKHRSLSSLFLAVSDEKPLRWIDDKKESKLEAKCKFVSLHSSLFF